jgi:hypothetical protein
MATEFNVVKVKSFSMGDVGADGAPGGSLTDYFGIKNGTLAMAIGEVETTGIGIEEAADDFITSLGRQPKSYTLQLLGLQLSDFVTFMGGTFTAGTAGTRDKYEAPATPANIIQTTKIIVINKEGVEIDYTFPRCQILASQNQTLTKDDGVGLDIRVDILGPVDASNTPLTPWIIEGVTVP